MDSLSIPSAPDSPQGFPSNHVSASSQVRQPLSYDQEAEAPPDSGRVRSPQHQGVRGDSAGIRQGHAQAPGTDGQAMNGAVVYRRQSLDRNADELGIERQLAECERAATRRGLTVDEVITDNSVSASRRGRPGYDRLVQMMRDGQVRTVIILRIDRLLRLNDELEELIQVVEQHPVTVITVEGEIDLATPQGRLIARILVSVARSEIEIKSARHKLANEQRAMQGKPHAGGPRSYGYEPDGLTIRESEATVIRTWADMIMTGHGYRHCAYWSNEQGHVTTNGNDWFAFSIRNILQTMKYAGLREYNGEVYRGSWQPVFKPDEWEALQAVIRAKREHREATARPRSRKYLLTGVAFCGTCGNPLSGSRRGSRNKNLRVYICRTQSEQYKERRGCGGVSRGADALDEWVRQCVLYRLDSPQLSVLLMAGSESGNLSEVLSKRDELRLRKDALTDAFADGTLDKPSYKRAVTRVEGSIAVLDREVDQLSKSRVTWGIKAGESVAESWAKGDDEYRRSLLSVLIERVTVSPSIAKPYFYMPDGTRKRFDPESVDIEWRV